MSEAPGRGRQECLSFFLRFQEVLTLSGLRRGRGEPCGHPGSESMDAHDRHATEEQACAGGGPAHPRVGGVPLGRLSLLRLPTRPSSRCAAMSP